ncbi:MAG TPA: LytR C-terminal domain-containing protein [Miltoncostaeaceae bacterium]|nr:LytR C-terminal domain-containing protein [Miltoncostaeaceae bacterium]
MSSRTRPPVWETEYDERYDDRDHYDDEPVRQRGGRRPPQRQVRKVGIPIVGLALAGGLLMGYLANSGGGGTVTETVTATKTVTAAQGAAADETGAGTGATAAASASRGSVALAILNGSGESGLAAATADQARTLGYQDVTEGNSPEPATADRVLYRSGAEAQARLVATDLGLPAPLPAAQDSAADAEPSADVVVVLGGTQAGGGASDAAASDGTAADGASGGAAQ